MNRYHPITVILHWLLAVLVISMLVFGSTRLAAMPNDDPSKLTLLSLHRGIGIAVLVLTVVRIVARRFVPAPGHLGTGSRLLDKLGIVMPRILNILVILMAGSGIWMARQAGLSDVLAGAAPMPESFYAFPARVAHGILADVIIALLVVHVLGAFYHQIMLQDRLFSRLWFGK